MAMGRRRAWSFAFRVGALVLLPAVIVTVVGLAVAGAQTGGTEPPGVETAPVTAPSTTGVPTAPAGAPLDPLTIIAATGPDGVLQIAVREIRPFAFPTPAGWSGYSIDMWETAAAALTIRYEYVQVETVKEQLDAVRTGRTDAALGAISITAEREAEFDFTVPIYDSGLQVMVRPASTGLWRQMLKLFSSTVLLLVLGLVVLLVIVGHIIWLVERRRNDHFPKPYAAGVWEGIWWAIVTMSTVGYGDRTVSTRTGRLIAMAWMLVGLVLVAQFTAIITSTLTVDRIYSDIRGVQDLYGKDVVTVADTTAARFLDAQGIPARRVTTIDEAFDAVRSGSAAAVVYDSPVLRYYAATEGAGDVEVVGPLVQPQGYGMAFPEGSPLVPPLNLEFLKLREDGTAQELDDRYFGS